MKALKRFKTIALIITAVFAISTLTSACGSGISSEGASGSITISGATSFQPLIDKAAKDYMAKNNKSSILVQGGGSGTGLTQVASGNVNIGNSDVVASEKLKDGSAKNLVDHIVCVSGFAAIVNTGVSVDSLTQQQLISIFTGKVNNWKDVGGNNLQIVLVSRPQSSGTRATFKKYALNGNDEVEGQMALTEDSSGTVLKTVSQTAGAISYVALPYINSTVKALKLNGVEPSIANVAAGNYPVWSYEHMYTKGEATGLAKAFLEYMMTDDVQAKTIPEMKFVPIKDMKVKRD